MRSRFIEMFKNSQKVNLKDVSEITMGQSPDSITYNTEKDGLPFFQGKTEFKEKYIGTPSVWCNAPKKIANSNDILMSVRAPVGDVNITLEKCCIGRGLASIRAKNISTEYLFFALSLLKDEIESKGVGSTFKAINKDIIESIQIPSVDKKLQNDFSEFFIQIDKSKFLLQQMIEKLELLKKSRFIEMFEKEKYPVVNLEELIDKNIETAKKDFSKESIIKYIDISSIDNVNHRIIGYNEFVLSDAPSRAQQHIRFNDILVSTVRPNLKNVARVELKDSNLVASSGFCVLRPKKCSSEYLLSIVKSDKFTLDMSQAVSGATYPAIKDSDIYNYKIKYPPKEIQNAFSLFVKQLDKSKFWTKILG